MLGNMSCAFLLLQLHDVTREDSGSGAIFSEVLNRTCSHAMFGFQNPVNNSLRRKANHLDFVAFAERLG
jgi:hypothetical protein